MPPYIRAVSPLTSRQAPEIAAADDAAVFDLPPRHDLQSIQQICRLRASVRLDEADRDVVAELRTSNGDPVAGSFKVIDASTAHRTAPGWVFGFPELAAGQAQAVRGELLEQAVAVDGASLARVRMTLTAPACPARSQAARWAAASISPSVMCGRP